MGKKRYIYAIEAHQPTFEAQTDYKNRAKKKITKMDYKNCAKPEKLTIWQYWQIGSRYGIRYHPPLADEPPGGIGSRELFFTDRCKISFFSAGKGYLVQAKVWF